MVALTGLGSICITVCFGFLFKVGDLISFP